MNFLETLDTVSRAAWQRRKDLLGSGVDAAGQLLDETAGEEQGFLRYILATLPATDLTEYGPELFLKILRQAEKAREDFSWCAALEPRNFLLYVAYPRVNDEELSDCREQFRNELEPRIRGLSIEDAILEVNRWCGENVTYRLTDERTNSAAKVYRLGYGRCGEESLFAVTALRSVGIAARQVYCPWWSHCDDNHAWVEAFDGERWRYFGACEPEPVLDRGWFNAAASRAMVLHTRVFTGEGIPEAEAFFGVKQENFTQVPGIWYELVTQRYADTSVLTVKAESPDGAPVSGARIVFAVLNMGAFLPIGQQCAGADGTTKLRLGFGSVKVSIFTENRLAAETLVENPRADSTITLRLSTDSLPESFDFIPPIGGDRSPAPLSPEQKSRRREDLERAAQMRAQKGEGAVLPPPEEPIDLEPLLSWMPYLKQTLTQEQLEEFSAHPESVWPWVLENHKLLAGPALPQATPSAVMKLGAGTRPSLRVLACGVLRCAGVPARIALDKTVEYRRGEAWCSAEGRPQVELGLQAGESPVMVSRLEAGETRLFTVNPGESGTFTLTPGRYRLTAVTRVPSGAQLARQQIIELAGETRSVTLEGRAANVEDLFTRYALPELGVRGTALLCYVEPGSEPTEHLLGELKEVGPMLEALGCTVKLLRAEEHAEAAEELARKVFNEPGRLPLALLCEDDTCIYSCAGYNVGTGELLVRLLKGKIDRRNEHEI